ncbi:MAG: hypothetical protein NT106_08505 [Candidatus Sumerlaeota bacterium]|nr:hypothetical protein [Candidatus Sumerlaeota bacterium]
MSRISNLFGATHTIAFIFLSPIVLVVDFNNNLARFAGYVNIAFSGIKHFIRKAFRRNRAPLECFGVVGFCRKIAFGFNPATD